jgi:hypothetical protein
MKIAEGDGSIVIKSNSEPAHCTGGTVGTVMGFDITIETIDAMLTIICCLVSVFQGPPNMALAV